MSKDKYPNIFSCKIEAIVIFIPQLFCNARERIFELNLKRRLIEVDLRFANWGISLA